MAGRIRSIKPEILEDEKTAALSHLAWRLFVSLWLIADDYGNLRGDPVYVLGQTLWATRETRETIGAALEELAGAGLLVRYTVRGQGYYHIPGWSKHQKVDHPGKPRMPGPNEADTKPSRDVKTLAESSPNPRETLAPDRDRDLRPGPPTENLSLPHAIPPAVPQLEPTPVPAVSQPTPAHEDIAGTNGSDRPAQTETGQNRPFRPAAVEATLRANPPLAPRAFDPTDPFARGQLAEATYRRVSDARIALAAELKLPAPLPFPLVTPGSRTRGFDELSTRIREEGALAPAACDRVVENAVKQARAKRAIDWLAERLFGDKAWANARDGVDPSARSALGSRQGPAPAPPRARAQDPPPALIPRDQLAGPEQFAEARELLAKALTSNDDDTPDPEHRRRKAAT